MVTTTGYDSEKQAFAALSTLLIPAFDNETPKLNRCKIGRASCRERVCQYV